MLAASGCVPGVLAEPKLALLWNPGVLAEPQLALLWKHAKTAQTSE